MCVFQDTRNNRFRLDRKIKKNIKKLIKNRSREVNCPYIWYLPTRVPVVHVISFVGKYTTIYADRSALSDVRLPTMILCTFRRPEMRRWWWPVQRVGTAWGGGQKGVKLPRPFIAEAAVNVTSRTIYDVCVCVCVFELCAHTCLSYEHIILPICLVGTTINSRQRKKDINRNE